MNIKIKKLPTTIGFSGFWTNFNSKSQSVWFSSKNLLSEEYENGEGSNSYILLIKMRVDGTVKMLCGNGVEEKRVNSSDFE